MLKPKSNKLKTEDSIADTSTVFFERMEPKILLSADALSGLVSSDPFHDDAANTALDLGASVDLLSTSYFAETDSAGSNLAAADDNLYDLDPVLEYIGDNQENDDNVTSLDTLSAILDGSDSGSASRQEIIFIDAATPDYQELLSGIDMDAADTDYQIFILQSDRDGVEQITEILGRFDDVDAVHLLGHGNEQGIQLGDSWLGQGSLSDYAESLSAWSGSLSEEADILIYGCNLAAADSGRQFINELASITEADVAASDDLTGNEFLGGDWDLEYQTGYVDNAVAFDVQSWNGLLATTFIVNTVNDTVDINPGDGVAQDGSGNTSLRAAIMEANALTGLDTIEFNIGGGVQTIQPTFILPDITDGVILDATTQPGFAGTPIIELNGSSAGAGNGLTLATGSDGSTISGLVINRFAGNGIHIASDNNTIETNYIGTNVTGDTDLGNSGDGVRLEAGASNNTIGGSTSDARNVISGNDDDGIAVAGSGTSANLIQGNYIGTDASGTAALGNADNGVVIYSDASDITIGGNAAGEGNIISANGSDGIQIGSSSSAVSDIRIQGNLIGTDVTGASGLANTQAGIDLVDGQNISIGGSAANAGNTIAFNGEDGIELDSIVTNTSILANSIYANAGLGIDWGADGVTGNDTGEQNYPVLDSAATNGVDNITISGTIDSTADTLFRIEFFASSAGDPTNHGEGEIYLGFTSVMTNGSGIANVNVNLAKAVAGGSFISATATGPAGNTSEFSLNVVVDANAAPVLDNSGSPTLTTINESEVNNQGDLVSAIIASAGGDPITDGDAGAVEGIAVISVDDSNGSWEYSTDGGSTWTSFGTISDNSAVLLGDSTNDRIRFIPDTNFNGTALIAFRAWDQTDGNPGGSTGVDASAAGGLSAFSAVSESASITVTPVQLVLHLATAGDVTGSGVAGLDAWSSSEVLALGDPNIAFEPGTSDGTLSSLFDLGDYASASVDVEAMHVVSSNITVGGGGNTIDLEKDDILFSVAQNGVIFTGLDSVAVTTEKIDVIRFRPSDETFAIVLDGVALSPAIGGISLVEKATTVGDVLLSQGSFLLNSVNTSDLFYLQPTGAGAGIASGTPVLLIAGANIGLGGGSVDIGGIDLIEDDISPGNATLTSGQILVTLDGNDADVGDNDLVVTKNDIFYLDVTATNLGFGATAATATVLVQGSDINLDTSAEIVTALSLDAQFGIQSADPVIALSGGAVNYTENDPPTVIDAGATLTDADSLDFDGGQLRVDLIVNGTANDRLAIYHQGTAAGQVGVLGNTVSYGGTNIGTFTGGGDGTSPLIVRFNSSATIAAVEAVMQNTTYENVSDDPSAISRTVRFTITDGDGAASNVETETINVNPVNDAPTADATNAEPYVINEGESVTLDGSASSDPEAQPLTYEWDLDNDGIFGEPGEATGATPFVSWATLQSFGIDDDNVYTIGLRVTDDMGLTNTTNTTLTVNNIAPTLTTTGAGTVNEGDLYTLNLSAVDPGDDTITGWTINWGDGSIQTIAGNPASITHTFNAGGFSFNILASATDEDGTFLQNELLVPGYTGEGDVFRFEENTGAFLDEFATAGELKRATQAIIGPDGDLYVSGEASKNVLRYDAETGALIGEFVAAGSGGLKDTAGIAFGPDGNLYVASWSSNEILRYDGADGTFIDEFISGVNGPYSITFGPDGNLYVGLYAQDEVYRYDATTGAFIDKFVSKSDNGGLDTPEQIIFGPDGDLYIASFKTDEVLRYDGSTGAFKGVFVSASSGGLNDPSGLAFGPDGKLYVTGNASDNVLRYHGTTGVFIDEYVTASAGGLDAPTLLTFLPGQQVNVNAKPILDLDVNDSGAPGNDYTFIYNEGDAATAIADSDTDLVDIDSSTFDHVSLTLSGLLDGNAEVLLLDGSAFALATANAGQDTGGNNYHVVITTGAGMADVMITRKDGGSFSEAETETLIKAIQYQHTDTNTPSDGDRSIGVTVNDGKVDSAVATSTINVNPVNDAPTASGVPTDVSVTEDTASDFDLSAVSFADVEGDSLSVTLAASAGSFSASDSGGVTIGGSGSGSLTLSGTAASINAYLDTTTNIQYSGALNASGDNAASFTLNANDGTVNPQVGSGNIDITPVNDVPTNTPVTLAAIDEDSGARLITQAELLANSNDVDGDVLTATNLAIASGSGTLLDNGDGSWSYTPAADDNSSVSFSYTVSDGALTATGSASLDITPVNDVPVANNEAFTINEGSITTLNLAANDSDADGTLDLASITITTAPTNGSIVVNADGTVDYSHDGSETLADSFSYTIMDNSGAVSNSGSVNITVNPVNDAPLANNDAFTVNEGSTTTLNLAANDSDVDGTLDLTSITITTAPTNGFIVVNDDGSVDYTHDGSETLADSFSYTIMDNSGVVSNTGFINLNVMNASVLAAFEDIATDADSETPDTSNTENTSSADDDKNPVKVTADEEMRNATNEAGIEEGTNTGSIGTRRLLDLPAFFQADNEPGERNTIIIRDNDTSTARQVDITSIDNLRAQFTDFSDSLQLMAIDSFISKLDEAHEEIVLENRTFDMVVGGSMSMSAGFSVGYAIWLARSGVLMSGLLSSMPAWSFIDPLPVLANMGKKDNEDDESLESMVEEKEDDRKKEDDKEKENDK